MYNHRTHTHMNENVLCKFYHPDEGTLIVSKFLAYFTLTLSKDGSTYCVNLTPNQVDELISACHAYKASYHE